MVLVDAPAAVLGRSTSNFKIEEDIKLANAYVVVTTNAAIGTDQDGHTFWTKVREHFVRGGGTVSRSISSLKNRFNKVLQMEVNKYIGNLHAALREYHSGWQMLDYTAKAKADFQVKQGKLFKHEIVFGILRRNLPKYELVLANIDQRVVRALFLYDNDREEQARNEDDDAGDDDAAASLVATTLFPSGAATAVLTNNNADSVDVPTGNGNPDGVPLHRTPGRSGSSIGSVPTPGTGGSRNRSILTARPTIGKKKAKFLAQQAAASKKMKKGGAVVPDEVQSVGNLLKMSQQVSLERLALAAETKNNLVKEHLMLQIFSANPTSAASMAWFQAKALEYSCVPVVAAAAPPVPRPIQSATTSSTSSDDVPVSFSDDHDVKTPDDDDVLVSSSDDDVVEALPDTQKLLGRLVDATHTDTNSDDEEEEDDTQMTTLSVITTLLT